MNTLYSCALGGSDLGKTENWVWNDGSDNTLVLQTSTKWDNDGLWAVGVKIYL